MKVLIADDELVSRRLIESKLVKWGYEVTAAADGQEAADKLRSDPDIRLVILDWMMPEMDGLTLCRWIRSQPGGEFTYIILLTAKDSKADLVAGLQAGADDYISKPFDSHELEMRVRAGRRIVDLQTQLLAAQEALQHQATHDALTGLWNRPAILNALRREQQRARREGKPLCVVMLDLDHFKRINDTYGHAAGDDVLYQAAQRIQASLRPYDEVGRYGGEEFLIVLSGCGQADGLALAERLRQAIAGEPLKTLVGPLSITASLGLAASPPDARLSAGALVRAADAALYRAKEAGRNRVEAAPSE